MSIITKLGMEERQASLCICGLAKTLILLYLKVCSSWSSNIDYEHDLQHLS